ncbi:hypothetical protein [Isoptericola variabilis]|uniref:hypothetical protein n=1 Tax=Isoptericola variabilis TaxID=139208 RepID=UPI00031C6B1A|nr:hypothetical protein [Isoptericola variabilis]TWH30959.1 arabinan endo-1,5-alpha-L-arabinosidase [Isoptericola variabilis J7]
MPEWTLDYGPNHLWAPDIVRTGDTFSDSYHVQVGRSRNLTGPYVDREGVPLLDGGGTVVLETDGGAGGQDVIREFGRYYMVNHYY